MSQETDTSASIVKCELRIPLYWNPDMGPPQRGETLHLQNLQRFQAIDALETPSQQRTEPPSSTEAELHRVETKLNLALDLLATLLGQTIPLPAQTNSILDSSGAEWLSDTALETGGAGRLHLYLHPLLAQPIALPASLTDCKPASDSAQFIIRCEFDPMPDDLNDALQSYIFRGHRRAVAEKKLQGRQQNDYSQPSLE